MLQISKPDVVADPILYVIKQEILSPTFFDALEVDFPGRPGLR